MAGDFAVAGDGEKVKKKGGDGDAVWRWNGTERTRADDRKGRWFLRWFWRARLCQPDAWLPTPLWLWSFSAGMA
jgi:hypothetical protein